MKKHCQETLAEQDRITEQQKTLLETTLNELQTSRGNAQELQSKVDKLTANLKASGARPTAHPETQTEPTINTLIIKNVPADGKLRFGKNN
jgi:hypothetical protein